MVAPFAGAWIEIIPPAMISKPQASLPSRERGLKLLCPLVVVWYTLVAPFAGAWIEMPEKDYFARGEVRRSLRGSVD